jgi:hypothetical protein
MARRGRTGRQRAPASYRESVAHGVSPTAPTGVLREEHTVDSTSSGPTGTMELGGTPSRGLGARPFPSGRSILVGTFFLALLSAAVWAVTYLEGIKTTQVEQAVHIKNLEKGQDSLTTTVKDEVKRLEAAIHRGLSDVIERFRGQSPAPTPKQQNKPGG